MSKRQIVADTNVFITALRSKFGASYKLFSLINSDKFQFNLSVPLALEYEAVAKRLSAEIGLSEQEIDDILDYVISRANRWEIYYLWRPELNDPNDDMVLELAVTANSNYILTYDTNDFKGVQKFGIEVMSPKEFLQMIGEI